MIEVLNKVDLVPPEERKHLKGGLAVSGLKKQGLDELLAAIDEALVVDPLIRVKFRVPQSEGAALAALEGGAILEKKRFEGNLAYVTARGPASLLNRFIRFRERP
jgi:GTP-binding protein HflX